MVFIAPLIGAVAILSGYAAAIPTLGQRYSPSVDDSSSGSSSYGQSNNGGSYDHDNSGSSTGSYNSGQSKYGGGGSYNSGGGGGSQNYNQQTTAAYNTETTAAYNTKTTAAYNTQTTSANNAYSTPSYGSGNSNWGGSGYDSCVQQCMASYGAPSATYQASATGSYGNSGSSGNSDSSGYSGSSGNGATHTVIVAPTQGVLRFVPFALNASVGDTVQFMWGANNHTVTKSSELTPCNKTSDKLFASGEQNKGFTFTQVVNDTNPTFFYCGTPTHCEKGMFGIINPPNTFGASTSVGMSMPSLASNDSDIAAMMSYTNMQTSNNSAAASWGANLDMSSMPAWSHSYIAENTMYTRTFLAANPDTISSTGAVNLNTSVPLMIPQDITAALNANSNSTSASTASATSASATPSSTSSGYGATSASKSGAISMASPSALVAMMSVVVAFLAL